MKIEVRNFRGCERADINVSPIALLVGDGGAAKSSILQAAAAAATSTPLPFPGLTKSKAKMLVRRGCDKASVVLENEEGQANIEWPASAFESYGNPVQASTFAAGLESLVDIDPKKRASVLSNYINLTPTRRDLADAIKDARIVGKAPAKDDDDVAAIKDLGLDPETDGLVFATLNKIWDVIDIDGWEVAAKKAKEKGANLKGRWQEITDANYGSKIAESWRPHGWSDDLENETEDSLLSKEEWARGELENLIGEAAVSEDERERLKVAAEQFDAGRLKSLREALAVEEEELEAARDALRDLPDLSSNTSLPEVDCPHCGEVSYLKAFDGTPELVSEQVGPSHDEIVANNERRRELEDEVNRRMQNIADCTNQISLQQEAETAVAKLEKLDQSSEADADQVAQARKLLEDAQNNLKAFQTYRKALERHKAVLDNQAVVDLLGEKGVRRTVLLRALKRLNEDVLAPLSAEAGWRPVTIAEDLEAQYDGHPYVTLCDSEKFRCRCILQVAMAKIDGSRLIVMDSLDRLPKDSRGDVFKLLLSAGIPAIVAVMLSDPASAPDLSKANAGTTYVIDDGIAHAVQAMEEAA